MRLIKIYPNRKVYDYGTSSYTNHAGIKDIVKSGDKVQIIKVKRHESGYGEVTVDITRPLLAKIYTSLVQEELINNEAVDLCDLLKDKLLTSSTVNV